MRDFVLCASIPQETMPMGSSEGQTLMAGILKSDIVQKILSSFGRYFSGKDKVRR